MAGVGIKTVKELQDYLRNGDIALSAKQMIIDWKENYDHPTGNWYQYYFFILHPEEIEDFTIDKTLCYFLRHLSGYRAYTVSGFANLLPIYHLDINPKLREMIGKDYVDENLQLKNNENSNIVDTET